MADEVEFCICQCFFNRNIFLKSYEAHVVFESEEQFQYDYKRVYRHFMYLKVSKFVTFKTVAERGIAN